MAAKVGVQPGEALESATKNKTSRIATVKGVITSEAVANAVENSAY